MDAQALLAVLGTAAGVVSAYYAFLQHRKSRVPETSNPLDGSPAPKLWSAAVDKAIATFRNGRRECTVEMVEQKNFDKPFEQFSTSELVLHVKYLDAGDGDDAGLTHRFELKINKAGDILEMQSKGKRKSDREKFR